MDESLNNLGFGVTLWLQHQRYGTTKEKTNERDFI